LRRLAVLWVASLCLLAAGSVLALGGAPAVPIPGLTGSAIEVPGALRTNDGGAVLAARILDRRGSSRGRIATARLLADGALSLAYGREGVSNLHVDPRLQLTALAIDPGSGEAWIGARVGKAGPGEILAVDGRGDLRAGFGQRGVLRLPAADDSGPVALAWRPSALLIAAGAPPCRGCSLSIRDPTTGALRQAGTLPAADLAPPQCGEPAVTSAVFSSAATELVAARTAGGSGCAASVLTLGQDLKPAGPSSPPTPAVADPHATAAVVSASSGGLCIAATDPLRILIAPYPPTSGAGGAVAPRGTLLALVPLGSGSCAALIRTSGGRASVAQMSSGDRRAVIDRLPAAIAPLAMFRCHQHLLVIGATRRGREQAALVAPIPIRRGTFSARASAAALATPSTGCR
jgi:hypothetical protein